MEGRLEDASIAFRMPLICSGLRCWFPPLPFPIDPFLSPRKLTLTKCHACLLSSLLLFRRPLSSPSLPARSDANLFPLSSLDLKGE